MPSTCQAVRAKTVAGMLALVIQLVLGEIEAQEIAPPPSRLPAVAMPVPAPEDKPLPINLPTALQLANARPIDVALAAERIREAAARLKRANVLWLPSVYMGPDYFRHDGVLQDAAGNIINTRKQTFEVGIGPFAVFAVTDAIFEPLAARQVIQARQAGLQAAQNNSWLRVAESYFNVQQARGELAGAEDAVRRAEELVGRAEKLAPGLALPVETLRARTDLAERREDVEIARERWHVASAELVRLLRLEPSVLLEPLEPPHLLVTLVSPDRPVDELIPVALHNRPELAAQQALVEATLQRMRQEKLRPLIPSVWLRGASTNPAAPLAAGYFGGGIIGTPSKFGGRSDVDIELLWEVQNLGFGNRARVHERKSEHEQSLLELLRIQDQVAADVVQAHAQVKTAANRAQVAEAGLADAVESANKNFEGLGQTVRAGNLLLLLIRPQEAVAAVQSLSRAYTRYFTYVADYNRAQFRLYRALGYPAQAADLTQEPCPSPIDQPLAPPNDAGPRPVTHHGT